MAYELKRQTFETSLLSEYFKEKELRAQIGFERQEDPEKTWDQAI